MKIASAAVVGLVLVSAAVSLTACSSSSTSTEASASMVGGTTECTKEALAQPATDVAKALGESNEYTVDSVDCADGWAVTSGILGDGSGTGAPTAFIFEAEGQFWIPKTQEQACGTPNADGSSAAPADALIPAGLYAAGCLT